MISLKITSTKVLVTLGVVLALGSCNKPASFFSTSTGDPNRKTVVKIKDAGDIVVKALDLAPITEDIVLIELSRDPNSQADLNQPLTVKLVSQPSLIADYNTANGTNYIELPTSSYTFIDDISSITFAAGETIKVVSIKLDKSGLDLSNQYALGFSLTEVGTGAVISASGNTGLYGIIIKNKYDGHYVVTGTMVDAANGALVGDYPFECDLETIAPDAVIMYNYKGNFVGYYHPILNGGASSAYGAFVPVFIFDASDNVIAVENGYGQPSANGRSGELDPSGINKWDAATRDMDVKYWMNQPSVIAGHRTSFDEHFHYLRPR
jgi:Domain of unknown function (DUF1735)